MAAPAPKGTWKFIDNSVVVSRPGASITVRELVLTEKGRQAITTNSKGIQQGAAETAGPKLKSK